MKEEAKDQGTNLKMQFLKTYLVNLRDWMAPQNLSRARKDKKLCRAKIAYVLRNTESRILEVADNLRRPWK